MDEIFIQNLFRAHIIRLTFVIGLDEDLRDFARLANYYCEMDGSGVLLSSVIFKRSLDYRLVEL